MKLSLSGLLVIFVVAKLMSRWFDQPLFQYSSWASVLVGVLLTVGLLVVVFWSQFQRIIGGHLIAINRY